MTNPPDNQNFPQPFIGLPMWSHRAWQGQWFSTGPNSPSDITQYANVFNTIEGNTTFYSLPSEEQLTVWQQSVPSGFKFTFKLHQDITHKGHLIDNLAQLEAQLALLAPLGAALGLILIQLPKSFSPDSLMMLDKILATIGDLPSAVEVRHPRFFAKQSEEKAFNQCLMAHGANRIIMDTRALFQGEANDAITQDVRQKKPKVPVNVIATGDYPTVRFVGNNDHGINTQCLEPWYAKCHQWRCEGKTPYLFFHMPDNKDAPWLAQYFVNSYNQRYADYPIASLAIPVRQTQQGLFQD